MTTKPSIARAFAALLALAPGGCAFSSPPEVRYYSLRPAAAVEPARGGAQVPPAPAGPTALIDRFVVDEAYADSRLAYRRSPHELGYDPYARWAGTPATVVEEGVRDFLRASRLFADVRQVEPAGLGRGSYDLVVAGRVLRLEEVDDEEQWHAALGLELLLLDGKTRDVLHAMRFETTAPAEKRNQRAVVAALSKLLGQATARFADEVRPIVAKRRDAR